MAYKVEEDYRRNDGRGWEWELGIMVWGEDTTLTERENYGNTSDKFNCCMQV